MYAKLVFRNAKRSAKDYLVYVITMTICVMLFYAFLSITNLASFSKMRNVGGISQTEAQKSSDLYMKCRYLDELTEGRGVIFATGTPISNTMVL